MATNVSTREPSTVTVTINGGTIVGAHRAPNKDYPKALDIFYAVPYATAERFQPAQPCSPVGPNDFLDARRAGPVCPSPGSTDNTEESPLRLNIFRPRMSSLLSSETEEDGAEALRSKHLPVMIYIHGGAFNFGDALERDLASFVAWAPRDMIVVSVGYRLGALGFKIAAAAADDGDDDDGDGSECMNLGLADQRVAVDWVRKWIGEFGGAGDDLCLMGVSAGAHSIGHHMLHPNPMPFHKAILESGSPTARSVLSPLHPRSQAQHRSLRAHSSHKPLATIPLHELRYYWISVWEEYLDNAAWPFQPVVDGPGGLIPDIPLRLWDGLVSSPRAARLSVITGFCSHEGIGFVPRTVNTSADFRSFFTTLIPGLTDDHLSQLEALYPDPVTDPSSPYANPQGTVFGAQFTRLHSAYAHYAYICPILHTAHRLASAGATVYLYEYAALSGPFRAAYHGDQASIVAHDVADLPDFQGLLAVADEMCSRWGKFIASPRGELDDCWPTFRSPFAGDAETENTGQLLVFGKGNDEAAGGKTAGVAVQTRTLTHREKEQCEFWWARMELSQGIGREE